jgi:galactofuranosylgalactofuranosylrhamnosyl-N-acetylglucosaminyl-diphospho-decaprenol beta-1,5/1,6-galactofuranosyltransferase
MDPVRASRFLHPPKNPITIAMALAGGLVHNLMPVRGDAHTRPQLNIPAQDARWFLLSRLDGATVGTSDGRGVAFRKRDPRLFRLLLRRAIQNHLRLAREFPRMRQRYRRALPRLTGAEAWTEAFNSAGK